MVVEVIASRSPCILVFWFSVLGFCPLYLGLWLLPGYRCPDEDVKILTLAHLYLGHCILVFWATLCLGFWKLVSGF